MAIAAQHDERRFVDGADATRRRLGRLRAQRADGIDKDSREKNKTEKQAFMAEHGVPWLGWMAVGSLVFIAEISCAGKRNLPANSFAHDDDNVKRKLAGASFFR
jgi:hypothetical protein